MVLLWISLLLASVHAAGILSSVHALLMVRSSQSVIAWVLILLMFPWLGVPAYWAFGQNRLHGYVPLRRRVDSSLRQRVQAERQALTQLTPVSSPPQPEIEAVQRLAQLPFLRGNRAELLIDGQATFDSILAGMAAARHYVLVQFFIVKDDRTGKRLQEAMLSCQSRGVSVYFLYDDIGSHALPKAFLQTLRDRGVQVQRFHSRQGSSNRFQINFRNHRKIVIVDGVWGWLGGHNVGDEYVYGHDRLGHWRDTHLKLTGPAVLGLQMVFAEDWNWVTGETLPVCWTLCPQPEDLPVLIIPSGPADVRDTASLMLQQAIFSAERRIWITSPYCIPDDGVSSALQLAVLRGVDVRLLIPDQPDHDLVFHASFSFLGPIIDAGIKVYRYKAGFLHQKVFLVDDKAAGIGTVNLDNRSFRLNFEVTALITDSGFAKQVESMLVEDFEDSVLMTKASLEQRGLARKVISRICYLFAPIL